MPAVTCAQLPTDRLHAATFQFRLAAPAWVAHASFDIVTCAASPSSIGLTPRDRERSGSVPLRARARAEPRRFPRPTIPSVSLERTESADPPSRLSPSPVGLLVPAPADCARQRDGYFLQAAGLAWQVFACMRFTVEQPVREAVSYRGLFIAGWFGVKEKHYFWLEIYDRLRASEQAAEAVSCIPSTATHGMDP